MPRKFNDLTKQEWLKLYEEGKTEKWIALHAKCDLRTVKNGINDTRLKRDVVIARIDLVKEALRKHQNSMLEELDKIISSIVVPAKDSVLLSWHHGKDSVFDEPDNQTKQGSSVEGVMRRLLKEHLKKDKLWRALTQWEKANTSHKAAMAELQRKIMALLKERTGYNLVDNEDAPPYIYSYTAGSVFYNAAAEVAFRAQEASVRGETINSLEAGISINTINGDIKFRNSLILAVTPGREKETKKNLLDAFMCLIESPELKTMMETYRELEQITTKTKQKVENIRLLGLIPGQCEICRRLGI